MLDHAKVGVKWDIYYSYAYKKLRKLLLNVQINVSAIRADGPELTAPGNTKSCL
jgi:hypothetical protein